MERLTKQQLTVIELSLLEWYYEQASIRHRDMIRVEAFITERSYTLFTVYFAILSAALGYVLTHLNTHNDMALAAGCLALIVFTSVSIGYICRVMWPHDFMPPGKEPDKFAIPDYIAYFKDNNISETDQKKQIIGDELVELQRKTSIQEKSNIKRVEQTKYSIVFLLFGSFVAVISFLIGLAMNQ
ncbi:hypothetical protein JN06_02328 [Bacteroides zoogleoformans]|uniref:Uncharacterized protein n=1 Tax=Bacteroides zoogleoformans TaxID=28119 RepID=A0ABM6T7Q5_9BACE|nr:hypothetical protein [Bacteroides zoogleoformans]AVM52346.1 hypothetical protein C4H11_04760 [Bacteroides zoogleoformans]TWJ11236.1 hypothetical protein JN06_02328 [Bacteroides zoogleoformans]